MVAGAFLFSEIIKRMVVNMAIKMTDYKYSAAMGDYIRSFVLDSEDDLADLPPVLCRQHRYCCE